MLSMSIRRVKGALCEHFAWCWELSPGIESIAGTRALRHKDGVIAYSSPRYGPFWSAKSRKKRTLPLLTTVLDTMRTRVIITACCMASPRSRSLHRSSETTRLRPTPRSSSGPLPPDGLAAPALRHRRFPISRRYVPSLKSVARPCSCQRIEGCLDGPSRASGMEGRTMGEHSEVRGGPGYLNRFSASISGASAGVRPPCGWAAG